MNTIAYSSHTTIHTGARKNGGPISGQTRHQTWRRSPELTRGELRRVIAELLG